MSTSIRGGRRAVSIISGLLSGILQQWFRLSVFSVFSWNSLEGMRPCVRSLETNEQHILNHHFLRHSGCPIGSINFAAAKKHRRNEGCAQETRAIPPGIIGKRATKRNSRHSRTTSLERPSVRRCRQRARMSTVDYAQCCLADQTAQGRGVTGGSKRPKQW